MGRIAARDATVGVPRALGAAWRRTTVDPFGVLGPAMIALVLQATWVASWWHLNAPLEVWLVLGPTGVLVTGGLVAPLRAAVLGAGARAAGRKNPGLRRGLPLLGAVLLVGLLHVLALGIVGGLALVGAGLMLSYGLLSAASLWGALCLLLAVGVTFGIRVRFAYAPVRVVEEGRAAWRSLAAPPGVPWLRTAAVVLLADLAMAMGTVLAGAGALPGYALRDLALQRLWEDL